MSNWNGKIKCIKNCIPYFIEGEIYNVKNGCIEDNQGNIWDRYGKTYNNLNDFYDENGKITQFEEIPKPKLCEILGIEPYEKFKIEYYHNQEFKEAYEFDENGLLFCQDSNCHREQVVERLINKKYKIIKLPHYHFTEDEIIIMKALSLNGYCYIVRDKDGGLCAYDNKPTQLESQYDYGQAAYMVALEGKFFPQVQWGSILSIDDELKRLS